jgi:hypothetical protein
MSTSARSIIRTMAEPTRGRLALTLVLLAAFSVGGSPSQASQSGSGIFMKTNDWGYTVINLTNYTLDNTVYDVAEHDGCCAGPCGQTPFDLASEKVSPMRSFAEHIDGDCGTDPLTWTGTATFEFDGSYLADSSFQVVMVRQQAADTNLDHAGTWISLRPAPGSQNWSSAGVYQCGPQANPVDDLKYHNVMNLLSPKLQVTLYSMDNRNVVLVVRQSNENAAGWNDCSIYKAYPVDFADNGSDVVPQ